MLIILLPFVFLLVMHQIIGALGTPKPFGYTLQHPEILVFSALFSKVGVYISERWIIRHPDTFTIVRINYTSFGVMGVLIILTIVNLILNGGWVNPR